MQALKEWKDDFDKRLIETMKEPVGGGDEFYKNWSLRLKKMLELKK